MSLGSIEVASFTKRFGDRVAVRDLSFAIGGREIIGLVGPNGAGKTTTLRALSGVLTPDAGRLCVAGHDLAQEPLAAKRELALVPDAPQLYAGLTVWEHLELAAQIYDVGDWQEEGRALLLEFDLAEREADLASELSLGMSQKVAVAAALLHRPSVLLFDEPLTGLDPRGIRTLFDALRRRAQAGAAVVVSSHLLSQIEGLCTRFLVVVEGSLRFDGSKQEISAQLPALRGDASLEEIFFEATERPNEIVSATGTKTG
jgi:ABC-2 type transport system ATP-binding protein